MTCTALREVACELALDMLAGDERAAALAHLQTCAACREEVASLTRAADELLLLVPDVEPAPGLERRVLARIGDMTAGDGRGSGAWPRPAPPGRGRRRVLAAAAAVLVGLALAAALVVTARPTAHEAAARSAAMRTGAGRVVGEVTLDAEPGAVAVTIPDWVGLVHSYGATVDAPYWLMVRTADGTRDLRRLPPADERPWDVAVDTDPRAVRTVSVVDDHGTVWCSARFSA